VDKTWIKCGRNGDCACGYAVGCWRAWISVGSVHALSTAYVELSTRIDELSTANSEKMCGRPGRGRPEGGPVGLGPADCASPAGPSPEHRACGAGRRAVRAAMDGGVLCAMDGAAPRGGPRPGRHRSQHTGGGPPGSGLERGPRTAGKGRRTARGAAYRATLWFVSSATRDLSPGHGFRARPRRGPRTRGRPGPDGPPRSAGLGAPAVQIKWAMDGPFRSSRPGSWGRRVFIRAAQFLRSGLGGGPGRGCAPDSVSDPAIVAED